MPVHNESLFFANALAAAKEADNQAHLDKHMEKKLGKRRKEMEGLLLKVAHAVDNNMDLLPTPPWSLIEWKFKFR